jgi:hypothetical protein
MLSARSPKYPGLYDEQSGIQFNLRAVQVTEEQALMLAERRYMDGILIGEFDDEGRAVNEQPAKEWARDRRRAAGTGESGSGTTQDPADPPSSEATTVARKTPRSK